ncbi:dehydration-responsive element-binding protein 1E [Trifolium repens]|nr:dehydration-responsive element-binding protein 1E [Trifolium repens]
MFTTNNSFSSHYPSNSDTSLPNSVTKVEVRLAASTPKKRGGRKKFKETRHPVYRGVRTRNLDKWVCEMREPNKKTKIWLGTFPTAEMAARAHDVASMALRGRYACLNFADSAWRLPKPATTQAKDIQKTASLAAEAFRPVKTLMTNDIEMDMEFRFSLPKSNRVRRLPKSSKVRLSDSFYRIVCQSLKVLIEDQSRYLSR